MEITPIDIQQHQFHSRLLGYEKTAVDQFLESVAEELETLHLENQELKETLVRTRQTLEEMRETESTLKDALITTQKVTDDLKKNAQKESDLMIEKAQFEAEQVIRGAEEKRIGLINEIQEINRQKIAFETSLNNLLDRHRKMLKENDWPEAPVPFRPMAATFSAPEKTPQEEGLLPAEDNA